MRCPIRRTTVPFFRNQRYQVRQPVCTCARTSSRLATTRPLSDGAHTHTTWPTHMRCGQRRWWHRIHRIRQQWAPYIKFFRHAYTQVQLYDRSRAVDVCACVCPRACVCVCAAISKYTTIITTLSLSPTQNNAGNIEHIIHRARSHVCAPARSANKSKFWCFWCVCVCVLL